MNATITHMSKNAYRLSLYEKVTIYNGGRHLPSQS